jgi:hypothetical protein
VEDQEVSLEFEYLFDSIVMGRFVTNLKAARDKNKDASKPIVCMKFFIEKNFKPEDFFAGIRAHLMVRYLLELFVSELYFSVWRRRYCIETVDFSSFSERDQGYSVP